MRFLPFAALFLCPFGHARNLAADRELYWPSSKSPNAAKVRALEDEELALEQAGKADEAMAAARKILGIIPDDHRSMNVVAGLYGLGGKADEEIEWAKKAIAVDRSYWQAHINLGNGYFAKGAFKEAKASYARARKLNPKSPLPVYHLGLLEEKQKHPAAALALYLEAIELDPAFEDGHFNAGVMEARLGCWTLANLHLKRVLDLNPVAKDARQVLKHVEESQLTSVGKPHDAGSSSLNELQDAIASKDDARLEKAARKFASKKQADVEALGLPLCMTIDDPPFKAFIDKWKSLKR